MFNPEFKAYFDGKLANKSKPHRSSSEYLPNNNSTAQYQQRQERQSHPSMPPRSMSGSSVIMQHERLVDPQRLGANG
jgi:hypothetical protein